MKKNLKYIFLMLILTFIGLSGVSAASGATCVYTRLNGALAESVVGEVDYIVCKYNGSGNPICSVKVKSSKTDQVSKKVKIISSKISAPNFMADGKYKCPSSIYYESGLNIDGNGGIVYYVKNLTINSNEINKTFRIESKLNSSASSASGKNEDEIFNCPYKLKRQGYTGTLTLTINKTKKTITASIPKNDSAYACTTVNIQKYSNFEKLSGSELKANGCPREVYQPSTRGTTICNLKYQLDESDVNQDSASEFDASIQMTDANGNSVIGNSKKASDQSKIGDDYLDSCDDLGDTLTLIKQVYHFLRYLVPVLIIILSIVDFAKVILNLNDDGKDFKQAWTKFVKRLIVGAIILILPALLSMFVSMSGISSEGNEFFCIFN